MLKVFVKIHFAKIRISRKLASMALVSDNDPNRDVIFLFNTITDTANTFAPLKALSRKEMKVKAKP